jgi:Flp pilus assembly protein TadD
MSSQYRGVVKVAGSQLRGWLIDAARPERRVRFNLTIDGHLRGTYAANRRRRFLVRQSGSGEDTHGFSVPIRKQWISGEMQIVRIEDPADRNLNVSLSVKLGPAPNTHFEEQVVSGQMSIGGGDRAASEPHAKLLHVDDDESEQEVRPKAVNKTLMKQISALSDADLSNLLLAIDRDVVVQRLMRHERSGDWQSASVYRRSFLGAPAEQRLVALGRSAVKAHNYGLAARVASAAAALHPESFEAHLLAGNTKSLQGEFDEALRHLRVAERLEKDGVRAKREIAAILARMLRGEMPAEGRELLRAEYFSILRGLSASDDAIVQMKYRMSLAQALFSAGRYDEAIAASEVVLSGATNDTRALMIKARSLVARNRVAEAHSAYERILDIEPGHRGAKMNMRILTALREDESVQQDDMTVPAIVGVARAAAGRDSVSLVRQLADLPQRWICTTKGHADEDLPPEALSMLGANAMHRVGYVELASPDGRRLEFWRRDALSGLAESALLESLDDTVGLNRWKPFYGAQMRRETGARTNGAMRGIAALISRNGADLYGGGEHFLDSAADHHARQGFEPVVVGTRADLRGREKMSNGRRCAFVGDSPAELRKFLLENDVSLVHAISGTGFLVAEALGYANIPFLYGVHFWSEMLGDAEQTDYFDAGSGTGRFRREFQLIVSRATAIYANSQFTQKLVEEGFGIRCPIIYAVPRERSRAAPKH